ncbi:MAG: gamma-glutamylcyclotransferase [Haloarculaceae archaeon]
MTNSTTTDSALDLFVYGTLTDPDRAADLLDTYAYRGDAVLHGLHRERGRYPTLAPGGSASGRVLRTDDVAALDRYERVDRGLYVRVTVPRTDAEGTVETYVGDPAELDAPVSWPGDDPFPDCTNAYLDREDVTVSFK